MLTIPFHGSPRLGTIQMGMPDVPGTFTLDAINSGATPPDFGARVDYGFDLRETFHYTPGNLSGGTVALISEVPTPPRIVLLAAGYMGLAVLRRRLV